MSPPGPARFRFVQVEVPWPLGPPDGRYVLRDHDGGAASGEVTHVVVLATLGAIERRRLGRGSRGRSHEAPPEPGPAPVATGRATIIATHPPLSGPEDAQAWLEAAGEDELAAGLQTLNRVLHAHRLVAADPYAATVVRSALIAARVGHGVGEEVADGRWSQARELPAWTRMGESGAPGGRRRRLEPQARLAAVLGGRERGLACEELVLRARLDLDEGRPREAALQVIVALDAALAELSADPRADALGERLSELRSRRDAVATAAQAALSSTPGPDAQAAVSGTVDRIEAALRARAAASI